MIKEPESFENVWYVVSFIQVLLRLTFIYRDLFTRDWVRKHSPENFQSECTQKWNIFVKKKGEDVSILHSSLPCSCSHARAEAQI
jgi:hypothetical protein